MQIKGANRMGPRRHLRSKYAPAFAALNPSLSQVYFNIASASIIANALAN
jgi:hypothetical protein